MGKVFYTEHDIEDLVKQGTKSIQIDDNVVLTELAFEKADRLGMVLIRDKTAPMSVQSEPVIPKTMESGQTQRAPEKVSEIKKRVHEAVQTRLSTQVDPALLETIIDRVFNTIEWKN